MSQKSPNQPGANPNRNQHRDTSGQRPNMEQTMQNQNKSKQGPEDDHTNDDKSIDQLREERGGHGHSGHSSSRSGSESGN